MTTMTLHANSNDSFIENGLFEIFGTELTKPQVESESSHRSLKAMKLGSSRQMGADEIGGLYHRAGRAAFYYWMRQYSNDLGWKVIDFRLLPARTRIKRALTDLLGWMEREGFCKAELSDSQDAWHISVDGLTGPNTSLECNYFVGLLQELCSWGGGGKFYPARESQCQLGGAARCIFIIEKLPAD